MKNLHSAKQMQLGFGSERPGLSEMLDLPISTVTVSRNSSIYIEYFTAGDTCRGLRVISGVQPNHRQMRLYRSLDAASLGATGLAPAS